MDPFIQQTQQHRLAGIPASSWRIFLSAFVENKKKTTIESALVQVKKQLPVTLDDAAVTELVEQLSLIAEILV
jgi:hypothetical protein